ncbi:MAG: UDP-N-acetylglucosamine 2-epimerase, partial [Microcystaceae cyanobacterium]
MKLEPQNYILATIHRAENTDRQQRLTAIFEAFQQIAKTIPVVMPLHPRTQKFLHDYQLEILTQNLTLIDPVGYLEMVQLEKNARLIVTDSGGIQKEAYFYQVPCLTLREETEWTELVDLGWNQLVSSFESEALVKSIQAKLTHPHPQKVSASPYGQG